MGGVELDLLLEALLILGTKPEMILRPLDYYFFQMSASLFFFCQELNWEIVSLLAAGNASSLRSEVPADPAATVVLVTGSTAVTPSMAGASGQHSSAGFGSLPTRLPGLSTQLITSGCQTLYKFFKQTDQKPFWFTLITWMMYLVEHP